MPKKLLFGLVVVLLITNIATVILLGDDQQKHGELSDDEAHIDVNKPVATINGTDISYDTWMKALRREYGQKQLKKIVDKTVVQQMADERTINIDEKIIERELAHLVSIGGIMSEEETKKWKEQWREDIVFRYELETLLTEDVSIPETQIRTFFDEYKNQYNFDERIQISHIVVSDMATANKVKAELDEGASFSMLAQEYSIDDESREDGGYLGYFVTTSQFIPNGYNDVVSDMEPFTYSDPFSTDKGVALVYLHQTLPTITFTYDEIKPYIKNELALDEMNQNLDARVLWQKADVEWIYGE
ncbi:peptidylprolyl isomerase [Lentibacillus saliphilus]|uniref:peptidylprolyl isomerase n=1 Tax=Lentibacillus saliphilus TaxID=2737028 RepID=UPI001C30DA28|nr:peptidylprolyl isomerase [Lentibacillus saliphilus]